MTQAISARVQTYPVSRHLEVIHSPTRFGPHSVLIVNVRAQSKQYVGVTQIRLVTRRKALPMHFEVSYSTHLGEAQI